MDTGGAVCAIVGGGEGLGVSLAGAFAAEGAVVGLLSRTQAGSAQALAAARRANPDRPHLFEAADATNPAGLEAALGRVAAQLGTVDILIYNVRGPLSFKPPLEVGYDELRAILDLEVVGAFAAAKAVIPGMVGKGAGTLLYSSATAAFRGSARNMGYAAGKFGLRGVAQSLAKAYAAKGVHVAHVRLDCALDVPVVRQLMGQNYVKARTADPDEVAQSYVWIHKQPRSAWSNEVELRPMTEDWTY